MKRGRKIESVKQFSFTITQYDNGSAAVVMQPGGVELNDITTVTKYLMWVVSDSSGLSFEETMEHLVTGAGAFTGTGLKVLPGGNIKNEDTDL